MTSVPAVTVHVGDVIVEERDLLLLVLRVEGFASGELVRFWTLNLDAPEYGVRPQTYKLGRRLLVVSK